MDGPQHEMRSESVSADSLRECLDNREDELCSATEPVDQVGPFDWLEDDDAIVVARQSAVAVYRNARGEIIIRQKAGVFEEDDVVILAREYAVSLARAIIEAAHLGEEEAAR